MKRQPNRAEKDAAMAGTAEMVARAHHFSVTILSNRKYVTWRHRTLDGARALRGTLEHLANNSRKALVYAITPDGGTHLVPDSFQFDGENR